MIGISWTEMLLIGIFALIFIGPKELPALMQRMGKAVGVIRRMGNEFRREINRSTGLDTVTNLRKSITDPIKQTTAEFAKEFNMKTPTGTQPTGVITPKDPRSESVAAEIRAAVGKPTVADAAVKTGTLGPFTKEEAAARLAAADAPTGAAPAVKAAAKAPVKAKSATAKPAVAKKPAAAKKPTAAAKPPATPKAAPKQPAAAAKKSTATALKPPAAPPKPKAARKPSTKTSVEKS